MRPALLGLCGVLMFFAFAIMFGKDCQNYAERGVAEDALRGRALKVLKAPATAQFHDVRIVERSGHKYLGYVEVDAQNEFGALLRHRWCIVVEIDASGSSFYYGPEGSIMDCDGDNLTPAVLSAVKGLNHWDESDYWERSVRAQAAAQ